MRSFTYLALIGVVAFASWAGYNAGVTVAANDAAKPAQQTGPLQEKKEIHALSASSEMMQAAQTVSDSETRSLLQEQLGVMREQLAETKVMLSRLQVMSSACEAPTSVKPAGGDKHE
ncbi:hypothetical protein [Serratia ureilytica]|uniref:hypothetical protein n=1 Tax=Serratia ureilytica TaxID=300181 RepID=UPI0034C6A84F